VFGFSKLAGSNLSTDVINHRPIPKNRTPDPKAILQKPSLAVHDARMPASEISSEPNPDLHPSQLPESSLLENCRIRRTRHSGPGGQHRNKVETAIEILHEPTGVVSFAAERRSQEANRQVAVFRMRVLLAVRVRCVRSPDVQPTELWRSRCQGQKIHCSERHNDFPAMLSEAMDAIDAKEYDIRLAAAALGCSATQLVRFIAKVPEALTTVNSARIARGLNQLKP
jgi:hypothetical protein